MARSKRKPPAAAAPRARPNTPAANSGKVTGPNLAPGDPGYDPEKDQNVVGFQKGSYGSTWIAGKLGKKPEDLTPYDFVSDKDGIRPGEAKAPDGATIINLADRGVDESTVLPPLSVWKNGEWLSELIDNEKFMASGFSHLPYTIRELVNKLEGSEGQKNTKSGEIFLMYVVSGEGTPGNHRYRVYELPREVAADIQPHHPLMWTEELKAGNRKPPLKSAYGGGYGGGAYGGAYGGGAGPSTYETEKKGDPIGSAATKAASPAGLPVGVKVRCTGCGHWYGSLSSLTAHTQVCAGMNTDGDSDWAVMCIEECGCKTLDEASRCKPGYPRHTQEKKPEEVNPEPEPGGDEKKPEEPEVSDKLKTPTKKELQAAS